MRYQDSVTRIRPHFLLLIGIAASVTLAIGQTQMTGTELRLSQADNTLDVDELGIPSVFADILTIQEDVNMRNVSRLQAAVWTRDINKAHGVARALRVGTVHVNQYDEDDITVPFGGYKQSGNGREWGRFGIHDFIEYKIINGL